MTAIRTEILEKVIEQFQNRTESGFDFFSQRVKDLVDLELKTVADESFRNKTNAELLDEIIAIKKLLAINLNWSLETLLITRHLVEKLLSSTSSSVADDLDEILDVCSS